MPDGITQEDEDAFYDSRLLGKNLNAVGALLVNGPRDAKEKKIMDGIERKKKVGPINHPSCLDRNPSSRHHVLVNGGDS